MKRIFSFLTALIIVCSLGASALAADTPAPDSSDMRDMEEFKAIIDEMQADFDALTDKQRADIYKIGDKITAQYVKLIEKYEEYGIVSEEEAADFISDLQERNERLQTEGKMIGGFMRPPRPPHASEAPEE